MKKYTIAFKYTADGEIEIEAQTLEEAQDLADAKLEDLRGMGDLYTSDEVCWSNDEVEVI